MTPAAISSLGNNLSRPISEGVHKTDGAQFALLLSLYQEGFNYRETVRGDDSQSQPVRPLSGAVGLSVSLAGALHSGRTGEFNLLRSLLEETAPPPTVTDRPSVPVDVEPDQVLDGIQQSRAFANLTPL